MTADTFIRKSEEAISARQEHVDAFMVFSAALPAESVLAWTKLCQKWEKDRTQQNPFMNLRNGTWQLTTSIFYILTVCRHSGIRGRSTSPTC